MQYSTTQYGYGEQLGSNLYGDSEVVKHQDEELTGFTDLERYVPRFITEMREPHAFYWSEGFEVGREWAYVNATRLQLFAATVDTDWGCSLWEKMLDIVSSEDDTIPQRRSAIIAKLRSTQTCTPALLKEITEEITSVECSIIEDFANYTFYVQFVGQYGIVRGANVVRRRIDEIKPAHLYYEIRYRYVIWRELLEYTWSQLSTYTWDGLRILGHISRVTWHGVYNASFTWRMMRSQNWTTVKYIEEAME